MSIFNQFKTSKVLEEEGITIKFKPNEDGSIPYFVIGRACRSNTKWVKTFEAKTRPFKNEIDNKSISEEEAHKLNVDVFVSSLLYGWGNIQKEAGKNIPFSRESAIELFLELPELYETLNSKSSDMGNFLEANLKGDEKN